MTAPGALAAEVRSLKAGHQPEWADTGVLRAAVRSLWDGRTPVTAEEVAQLRARLAQVAAGRALVVQAGDCAEDPEECTAQHVARKAAVVDAVADAFEAAAGLPVVRVGRIGGQFAKPRSSAWEKIGEALLPVYRGHAVNAPEPDAAARRADPRRIPVCHTAALRVHEHLRARAGGQLRLWSSHEALLLDYELPLLRPTCDGGSLLASAHWPWVGERTRQPDGAHVRLLSAVCNPVACKVGPETEVSELLAVCERLDPDRDPGRLTLIARMGVELVAERLEPLARAVRAEGFPVIWLCDPMHGNTVESGRGGKIRLVPTMAAEVRGFRTAIAAAGAVAGGLHLETTPDDVTECVDDLATLAWAPRRITSFCDPRLTLHQSLSMVTAWTEAEPFAEPAEAAS